MTTKTQQNKLKLAEELAIDYDYDKAFTVKELEKLFDEKELKDFWQFMNYQTIGYDKQTDTRYYYLVDVLRFIKGLEPLD